MTGIDDLIDRQRAMNAPTAPEPVEPEPLTRSALTDLLERAQGAHLARWESLEVVLADEILEVSIGRASGQAWCDIEAHHPPTAPADLQLGYNRQTLPHDYPCDRIKLNDEHPSVEQWQAVYDLLDADDRKNIQAVMWGLNIGEPTEKLAELLAKRRSAPEDPQPTEAEPA